MRLLPVPSLVLVGNRRAKLDREVTMLRMGLSAVLCLSTILSLAIISPGSVSAATKKKLTYEEAWIYCKNKLDKEKAYGTTLQGNERFLRGGACMKHFGYNL
ncbi:MAG: hypothetical protein WA652_01990 [Xanthobacteraceae bacterium]